MIICKSPREIELMRESGKIVALTFQALKAALRPGISTLELDAIAEKTIRANGGESAEKNYGADENGEGGFPGTVCISVNDTLIHGIPSKKIILKEGDIVSFDLVVVKNGYMADACRTYAVGEASERAKRLMRVTEEAFWEGFKQAKAGNYVGDISHAIQKHVEGNGYSSPREFTGHGIGTHMHEDPYIPNQGKEKTGPLLRVGMTIAVEPMVNEGRNAIRILPDGWTVKTRDGKLSCHYENTIVITSEGPVALTTYEGEEFHVKS